MITNFIYIKLLVFLHGVGIAALLGLSCCFKTKFPFEGKRNCTQHTLPNLTAALPCGVVIVLNR